MEPHKNKHLKKCAELMCATDPWKKFEYSIDECESKLSHPELKLIIDLNGESIKGFIAYSDIGIFFPMVSYLCVSEKNQREGIGSNLLKKTEQELFKNNKNILLTVSDFNSTAIKFYINRGYKKIGEIENYNFSGLSELIFRKTLGPKREIGK